MLTAVFKGGTRKIFAISNNFGSTLFKPSYALKNTMGKTVTKAMNTERFSRDTQNKAKTVKETTGTDFKTFISGKKRT